MREAQLAHFVSVQIGEQPTLTPKGAKKVQYWEERRYYLTHKQEIDQLTRRYVRKQA